MKRSQRDKEILHALARKVRFFSLKQVAAAWWSTGRTPETHARRVLGRLTDAGFLDEAQLLTSPPLDLREPLFVWRDGEPEPDFGPLAWRMQSRFPPEEKPVGVTIYTATRATLNEFGGPSQLKRVDLQNGTHDLHLAAVYALFHRRRPADAAAWIGEDVRPKSGFRMKDPDAVLEYANGRRPLVVEFGGRSYKADHLRDFHHDCVSRGRDYELW